MVLDAETSQFINRLVSHVKNEHVFESVTEEWERNKSKYKGRWDTPARRIFGPVFRRFFDNRFQMRMRKLLFMLKVKIHLNYGKNLVSSLVHRYIQTLQF